MLKRMLVVNAIILFVVVFLIGATKVLFPYTEAPNLFDQYERITPGLSRNNALEQTDWTNCRYYNYGYYESDISMYQCEIADNPSQVFNRIYVTYGIQIIQTVVFSAYRSDLNLGDMESALGHPESMSHGSFHYYGAYWTDGTHYFRATIYSPTGELTLFSRVYSVGWYLEQAAGPR